MSKPLEGFTTFIGVLKDAFGRHPLPQQEPKYKELGELVKDDKGAAAIKGLELFYRAASFDAAKEIILALLADLSKLIAIYMIIQAFV